MATRSRIASRVVRARVGPQHDRRGDGTVASLDLVTAPRQFVADLCIDSRTDGQRASLDKRLLAHRIGIKRVLVVVCGKARRNDRFGRLHPKLHKVEQEVQSRLILQVTASHANGQHGCAILEHHRRRQGNAGPLARRDAVGVSGSRVEAAQAVAIRDACAAGAASVIDVRARRS